MYSVFKNFPEKVTMAVGNYIPKTNHIKEKKNTDWMWLEIADSIKDKHNK